VYGKIFDSIYDGTLRANWKALITFQQFIILAGPDGVIDMTPHAIHGRTGIPLDIIEDGIKHLAEPDPYSRSSNEDGRRIVLIDQARPWGWRLVNHAYYQKLVTRDDKRKADRERIAEKRLDKSSVSQSVANSSNQSQSVEIVANVAYADSDAYADSITTLSSKLDAPPLEQKKNGKAYKAEALDVLTFLNEKTARRYKSVDANIDMIVARLREGYTPTELRQIIARKTRAWLNDEKMAEYLRPATLFNRKNCAQYSGELGAPKEPQ
jgi:uncharacterized phage protein (TIGR02220 family)